MLGWDRRTCRVKLHLANRDSHSVGTDVTQAEDAASAAYADESHILDRPVREYFLDLAALLDGEIDAIGTAVDVAELQARGTDHRIVDDG